MFFPRRKKQKKIADHHWLIAWQTTARDNLPRGFFLPTPDTTALPFQPLQNFQLRVDNFDATMLTFYHNGNRHRKSA